MRMPNGYGSVIKLGGKRRKPYAVRTSDIGEFVEIISTKEQPDKICKELKKLKFQWRPKTGTWSALSTGKTKEYAEYLQYEYGYDISVSFRQYYTFHAYFEKANEAYTYLAELNNGDVVKEQKRFVDSPTFAEMYEKWKSYKRGLKKQPTEGTWKNYEIAYAHLSPLHQKKFSAIRTSDIQEVLNQYNQKSSSTIGCMRTILRGMYHYGKMNKYVTEDMTEFLVYEWSEPEEEIHKAFTDDEIRILWDNVNKITNVDIVLIYIYTGMRPTELLEVLTENVHIDEKYFIGGMKTDYGKDRTIPIADKILPLIKNRYDKKNKYLINNTRGKHYTYSAYSQYFSALMDKFGFDHLPHDPRHTFASLMDSANANVVCTKLIMGHSMSGDITKSVYTHKTVEELLFEVNKI